MVLVLVLVLILVSTTMMHALMLSCSHALMLSRSHHTLTHQATRPPARPSSGNPSAALSGSKAASNGGYRPRPRSRPTRFFTLTLTLALTRPSFFSLSDAESDAYWSSRPREHQLGALAPAQSQPLGSDADLLARYDQLESQHPPTAGPIPRPDHWGGYVIVPHRIEFWQGRASRLHERLEYTRIERTWHTRRLAP